MELQFSKLKYYDAWKIRYASSVEISYVNSLVEFRLIINSKNVYHANFGITTGDKLKFYYYDGITDKLLWEVT